MRKIKVLIAMGGNMHRAGAETMIMQYLRQMISDRTFEFSILVHGFEEGDYDNEIEKMGVPIYRVPIRGKHPIIYRRCVKKVLKEHTFDIVHCNMDSSCGYFLEIAKQCGIKCLFAHSHLTSFQAKDPIRRFIAVQSRKKIHKVATTRLACSEKAGNWLYGSDDFIIVKNAIDLSQYTQSQGNREHIRNSLNVGTDTLVVGHVGRFHYQKNHVKLLNIFAELVKFRPEAILVLIGTGELIQEIKELAKNLDLDNAVFFLGIREDVPALLQAMDVFVMPSLFEGLPVSGIEAQAAGLPCLFADTITSEICMTDFAKRLPLDDTDAWIEQLMLIKGQRNVDMAQESLREHGYDIANEADKLKSYYLKSFLSENN